MERVQSPYPVFLLPDLFWVAFQRNLPEQRLKCKKGEAN
jgi:hypothetical protein